MRRVVAVLIAGLGIAAGLYLATAVKLGTDWASNGSGAYGDTGYVFTYSVVAPWQRPAGVAIAVVALALAVAVLQMSRR